MAITENLNLDVPCTADEFFQVHLVVSECGLGLSTGNGQYLGKLLVILDHAHTAAATAPTRLEHHWITNPVCELRALRNARG